MVTQIVLNFWLQALHSLNNKMCLCHKSVSVRETPVKRDLHLFLVLHHRERLPERLC